MRDAVGPGDLVLCVNAAPNHATGKPAPLKAGETYRVIAVMEVRVVRVVRGPN